jgi:hypothetical protein
MWVCASSMEILHPCMQLEPTFRLEFWNDNVFTACNRCFNVLGSMVFWVIDPLCLSSSLALHFIQYSFRIHHLVNQDGRKLLAHAMASDFSVPWHTRGRCYNHYFRRCSSNMGVGQLTFRRRKKPICQE